MAYLLCSEYFKFMGEVWLLNIGTQEKGSAIISSIIRRIIEQVLAMQSHHSKLLAYRFDLHLEYSTDNNEIITRFLEKFKYQVGQTYGVKRVGYVWVREKERAKQQHYHFVVLLDGHKVNYWSSLFRIVENAWRDVGGGTVHGVKTVLLGRGDIKKLQEVIYWLSYLAKARGKGYKAEQAKNYGASRIPPKDEPK
jgi:hypothetical protein